MITGKFLLSSFLITMVFVIGGCKGGSENSQAENTSSESTDKSLDFTSNECVASKSIAEPHERLIQSIDSVDAGADGEFYLPPYQSRALSKRISSFTNFYTDEGSTFFIDDSLLGFDDIVIHVLGSCTFLGNFELGEYNGTVSIWCDEVVFLGAISGSENVALSRNTDDALDFSGAVISSGGDVVLSVPDSDWVIESSQGLTKLCDSIDLSLAPL